MDGGLRPMATGVTSLESLVRYRNRAE